MPIKTTPNKNVIYKTKKILTAKIRKNNNNSWEINITLFRESDISKNGKYMLDKRSINYWEYRLTKII